MEKLLDVKQVSELLAVRESTLRAWVFQRKIPFIRVGRLVRFRPSVLEKWLQTGHSSTAA